MSNRRQGRAAVIGHQQRVVLVAAAPRTPLRLVDDLQLGLGPSYFVFVVPLVDQHAAYVVVGAPMTLDLHHSGSWSSRLGGAQHTAIGIVPVQLLLLLLCHFLVVVVIVVIIIIVAHLVLRVQAIAKGSRLVVIVVVIVIVIVLEIEDGAASAGSGIDAMAASRPFAVSVCVRLVGVDAFVHGCENCCFGLNGREV